MLTGAPSSSLGPGSWLLLEAAYKPTQPPRPALAPPCPLILLMSTGQPPHTEKCLLPALLSPWGPVYLSFSLLIFIHAARDRWPSSLHFAQLCSEHAFSGFEMDEAPTSKTSAGAVVPKPTPRAARLSRQNCRMLARLQPSSREAAACVRAPLAVWDGCSAWPLSRAPPGSSLAPFTRSLSHAAGSLEGPVGVLRSPAST